MNSEPKQTNPINRRGFLGAVWAISLLGVIGQAGAALFEFFQPRIQTGGFGGKVVAGRPNEFRKNTVAYVQAGHFYLVRLDDGGYLALWQRCTHLGCTVPWRKDEKQFHCPCHSSLYNMKGEVTGGPAPRALDLFPIELVNGNLVVDTGHVVEREKYDPSQAFQG
jgi:cytochrome b6-f complex iron-sulfur subunit